jgi:hypothetical protein
MFLFPLSQDLQWSLLSHHPSCSFPNAKLAVLFTYAPFCHSIYCVPTSPLGLSFALKRCAYILDILTRCLSSGCLPVSSYSLASCCVLHAPRPCWFESASPLVFIALAPVPLPLLPPSHAHLHDHPRQSHNRAPATFRSSRTLYAPIRAYG